VVDLKRPGNSRRISTSQIEVDADREVIRVSKQLLDAPQLIAIENFDNRMRRLLNSRCLPSLLRGGVFLLPLASVEEVDARLQQLQTERQALVETFLLEYPDLVIAAQGRLRGLFNSADYPAPEVVRTGFSFEWRYITFRVPDTLAAIDRTIFAREREKAAAQWNEAARSIQNLLRANMAELVSHMADRLTPDAGGKPKVFRNTAVSNLSEFLRHFDARNVIDDQELTAVVEQARRLLEGVSPDTLRSSQDIRETVRAGFSGLQRNLDAMISDRPARRIVLDRTVQQPVQQSEMQAGMQSGSQSETVLPTTAAFERIAA